MGEPFWRSTPDEEYLAWSGMRATSSAPTSRTSRPATPWAWYPLLALVSNGDEWDRYETLQWRAAARYAAAHPDDPDFPSCSSAWNSRHEYLTWGRETLGWALYLFAAPN